MNKRRADDNRAVAYLRVSTKDQQDNSPEVQEDKCRAYADRPDVQLHIIHKPFQEAASGWKANARVVFYQMLDFIEKEKVPNLIYAYPDRLSRNTEDYVKLKATGVVLHNADTGISFSPNDPDDFEHTAAFEHSQVESKKLSAKISKGVREGYTKIVQKGKFPHAVPLGYKPMWEEVNGKLAKRIVIDPVRGPMIQQMFRLFASGTYTRKAITTKMRDMGLRSRKGRIISASQIEKTMLRNPFYAGGQFRWKGELHESAGDWPPLVSKALFAEVRAVFEAKSRPRSRGGQDYDYKGLLTCGLCGSPYFEENHERRYFRCTYQQQACNKMVPPSPRLKGSELDLLLETAIGMIDFEPGVYDWMKDQVEETYRLNQETEAVERKRLEAEKEAIKAESARAFQSFTKGLVADEELVREEINRLSDRKAKIAARLKELDTAEEIIVQNSLDTLGILKDFKNQYISATAEKRRRMNFLLFRKISVLPLKQAKKVLLADPKRALLLGEYPLKIKWNEPFDWLFEGRFTRELGRLADEAVSQEMMLGWLKKPALLDKNEIERA